MVIVAVLRFSVDGIRCALILAAFLAQWQIAVEMKNPAAFQFAARAFFIGIGRAGVEPATLGLKGPCSTTELPARVNLT